MKNVIEISFVIKFHTIKTVLRRIVDKSYNCY